jgi:hypothetical protein
MPPCLSLGVQISRHAVANTVNGVNGVKPCLP